MKKIKLNEAKEYSIPLPDYQEFPKIDCYVVQVTDLWDESNPEISFVSDPEADYEWDCLDKNIEKVYRFDSFGEAKDWIEDFVDNVAENIFDSEEKAANTKEYNQYYDLVWLNANHSRCRWGLREFEVKVLACVVTAELQLMDLTLDNKRSSNSRVRENVNKDFEETSLLDLDFPEVK